jgi:hypothetical protein
MLEVNVQRKFVQALANVPASSSSEGRDSLLFGLPQNIVAGLNRSNNRLVDLTNILTELDSLGRLRETGERPLIILAHNALLHVEGTALGGTFKWVIGELEEHYGGDTPSMSLPDTPEILIFDGKDERLPHSFIERALSTARSVARIQVPRVFNGRQSKGEYGYGTGWLVTPTLLFTNEHVVSARLPGELKAAESDLTAQVRKATAWFDYYNEGGTCVECRSMELVCSDASLDYALLSVGGTVTQDRQPLAVARQEFSLGSGCRLNIVQCARGGPIKYAIRNNFYTGPGDTVDYIRYVTDTESGSSGSPVLNDTWQVIGMHHAYRQVPAGIYKGGAIKYHNQGIAMHAIMKHLPAKIAGEIAASQRRQQGK